MGWGFQVECVPWQIGALTKVEGDGAMAPSIGRHWSKEHHQQQ